MRRINDDRIETPYQNHLTIQKDTEKKINKIIKKTSLIKSFLKLPLSEQKEILNFKLDSEENIVHDKSQIELLKEQSSAYQFLKFWKDFVKNKADFNQVISVYKILPNKKTLTPITKSVYLKYKDISLEQLKLNHEEYCKIIKSQAILESKNRLLAFKKDLYSPILNSLNELNNFHQELKKLYSKIRNIDEILGDIKDWYSSISEESIHCRVTRFEAMFQNQTYDYINNFKIGDRVFITEFDENNKEQNSIGELVRFHPYSGALVIRRDGYAGEIIFHRAHMKCIAKNLRTGVIIK